MLGLVRLAARLALRAGEPVFSVRTAVDDEVHAHFDRIRLDEGPALPDPIPRPRRAVVDELEDEIGRLIGEEEC